jgi:hypothetical protein
VQAFALISDLGGNEAVELYVRERDAVAARDAAIADVPEWADLLHVEPVDLSGADPDPN